MQLELDARLPAYLLSLPQPHAAQPQRRSSSAGRTACESIISLQQVRRQQLGHPTALAASGGDSRRCQRRFKLFTLLPMNSSAAAQHHPDNQLQHLQLVLQRFDGVSAQLNARLDGVSAQLNARLDGVSAQLGTLDALVDNTRRCAHNSRIEGMGCSRTSHCSRCARSGQGGATTRLALCRRRASSQRQSWMRTWWVNCQMCCLLRLLCKATGATLGSVLWPLAPLRCLGLT